MKLSEHFTLEEMTFSETAVRKGIDNVPPIEIIENMKVTANGMEQIRALLGNNSIHINSCYRGPKLNKAIGGSTKSAHMSGYAVDFVCRGFGTPKQIVDKIITSNVKYDQLIYEGTWVHISFDPKMRRQNLEAIFGQGKTTYKIYES